jgi:hypothetical protein
VVVLSLLLAHFLQPLALTAVGQDATAGGGEDLEDVAVQLNNPVGTVWNIVKETKSWR